jgi:hypothetical protein
VFLVNSCLGLFTAATSLWHPFSRSYGVILPSSLTMVLSLTLGFSPHLPVSVLGTGTSYLASGFSRRREVRPFGSLASSSRLTSISTYFTILTRLSLEHTLPAVCWTSPSVSPLHSCNIRWYRNLYLLSISYGFRPRLRPRLTLSGRTFLRNPWIFGGQDSHLPCATHANILSPVRSSSTSISPSLPTGRSPTIHIVSVASV